MPPEPSALPARIGGYRVISRLGAGGMGEVFLAEDERLQRQVAIKRVAALGRRRSEWRPPSADRSARGGQARSPAYLRHLRSRRGPRRAVHCHARRRRRDAGLAPSIRTAVHHRLAQHCGASGRCARAAAHAQCILHRDIKPANLIISARTHVRVMDFGVAKFLEHESAETVEPTDAWPVPTSARSPTCRPNRHAASASTRGATCSVSESCCSKWWPAAVRSSDGLSPMD